SQSAKVEALELERARVMMTVECSVAHEGQHDELRQFSMIIKANIGQPHRVLPTKLKWQLSLPAAAAHRRSRCMRPELIPHRIFLKLTVDPGGDFPELLPQRRSQWYGVSSQKLLAAIFRQPFEPNDAAFDFHKLIEAEFHDLGLVVACRNHKFHFHDVNFWELKKLKFLITTGLLILMRRICSSDCTLRVNHIHSCSSSSSDSSSASIDLSSASVSSASSTISSTISLNISCATFMIMAYGPFSNHFWTCDSTSRVLISTSSPPLQMQLEPALDGTPSAVSISDAARPDFYLVTSGTKFYFQVKSDSASFRQSASFTIIASEFCNHWRISPVRFPDQRIRHQSYYLTKSNWPGDDLFKSDSALSFHCVDYRAWCPSGHLRLREPKTDTYLLCAPGTRCALIGNQSSASVFAERAGLSGQPNSVSFRSVETSSHYLSLTSGCLSSNSATGTAEFNSGATLRLAYAASGVGCGDRRLLLPELDGSVLIEQSSDSSCQIGSASWSPGSYAGYSVFESVCEPGKLRPASSTRQSGQADSRAEQTRHRPVCPHGISRTSPGLSTHTMQVAAVGDAVCVRLKRRSRTASGQGRPRSRRSADETPDASAANSIGNVTMADVEAEIGAERLLGAAKVEPKLLAGHQTGGWPVGRPDGWEADGGAGAGPGPAADNVSNSPATPAIAPLVLPAAVPQAAAAAVDSDAGRVVANAEAFVAEQRRVGGGPADLAEEQFTLTFTPSCHATVYRGPDFLIVFSTRPVTRVTSKYHRQQLPLPTPTLQAATAVSNPGASDRASRPLGRICTASAGGQAAQLSGRAVTGLAETPLQLGQEGNETRTTGGRIRVVRQAAEEGADARQQGSRQSHLKPLSPLSRIRWLPVGTQSGLGHGGRTQPGQPTVNERQQSVRGQPTAAADHHGNDAAAEAVIDGHLIQQHVNNQQKRPFRSGQAVQLKQHVALLQILGIAHLPDVLPYTASPATIRSHQVWNPVKPSAANNEATLADAPDGMNSLMRSISRPFRPQTISAMDRFASNSDQVALRPMSVESPLSTRRAWWPLVITRADLAVTCCCWLGGGSGCGIMCVTPLTFSKEVTRSAVARCCTNSLNKRSVTWWFLLIFVLDDLPRRAQQPLQQHGNKSRSVLAEKAMHQTGQILLPRHQAQHGGQLSLAEVDEVAALTCQAARRQNDLSGASLVASVAAVQRRDERPAYVDGVPPTFLRLLSLVFVLAEFILQRPLAAVLGQQQVAVLPGHLVDSLGGQALNVAGAVQQGPARRQADLTKVGQSAQTAGAHLQGEPASVHVLCCPHCSYMTLQQGNLVSHLSSEHCTAAPESKELEEPQQQAEPKVQLHKCTLCKTISTQWALMLDHMALYHDISDTEKQIGLLASEDLRLQPGNQQQQQQQQQTSPSQQQPIGSRKRKSTVPLAASGLQPQLPQPQPQQNFLGPAPPQLQSFNFGRSFQLTPSLSVTEQPQPEEVPAALDLSVKDVKTPQPPQLIPGVKSLSPPMLQQHQQQPPPPPPPLHTPGQPLGARQRRSGQQRHRASAARRAAKLSSPPMKFSEVNSPVAAPAASEEDGSLLLSGGSGGGGGRSKAQRQNFSPAQNRLLLKWFNEHSDKPYPSGDDTKELSEITGLNYAQVKKWFANKRMRSKVTGQGLDTQPLSSANSPQQWGDEAELCSINRMDQENLEKDSLSLNLNDHPMNSDSGEATTVHGTPATGSYLAAVNRENADFPVNSSISSRCGAAGRAVAGRAAASSGAFRDGAGAAAAVAAAAAAAAEIAARSIIGHCAPGAAAASAEAAVSGSDRVAADAAQPAADAAEAPGAVGGVDDGVGDRVAVPAGSRAAWAVPVVRVAMETRRAHPARLASGASETRVFGCYDAPPPPPAAMSSSLLLLMYTKLPPPPPEPANLKLESWPAWPTTMARSVPAVRLKVPATKAPLPGCLALM
uniref:Homeobox domain-containing protein n=1 Tax=Macrostomum lignano TaxID=282301 RepID=A0A1I8H5K5_9PLAT